ncbi:MAG: hypothetical protein MGF17_09000 [Trichodesmium sp. MAG_R04]|nr:hypothetical protein [Trichodesmium sp. MAG_R04]
MKLTILAIIIIFCKVGWINLAKAANLAATRRLLETNECLRYDLSKANLSNVNLIGS